MAHGPLDDLREKDFDAIYDETKRGMPHASAEQISRFVDIKMRIRQADIALEEINEMNRERIAHIKPEDIYEGWVLIKKEEDPDSDVSMGVFEQRFNYLRERHPDALEFHAKIFDVAQTYGVKVALLLKEVEIELEERQLKGQRDEIEQGVMDKMSPFFGLDRPEEK